MWISYHSRRHASTACSVTSLCSKLFFISQKKSAHCFFVRKYIDLHIVPAPQNFVRSFSITCVYFSSHCYTRSNYFVKNCLSACSQSVSQFGFGWRREREKNMISCKNKLALHHSRPLDLDREGEKEKNWYTWIGLDLRAGPC